MKIAKWDGVFGRFLIFASGADRAVLWECSEAERNRYQGLGGGVLTTAVTAAVAMTVAVHYAFHSLPAALAAGVLWGLAVFNLDRWLVSSYRPSRSLRGKAAGLAPRILLSLVLGITISEPFVLLIFAPEVSAEVVAVQQDAQNRAEREIKNGQLQKDIDGIDRQIADLREFRAATPELRAQVVRRSELEGDLDDARTGERNVAAQVQNEHNGSGGTRQAGDGSETAALRERLADIRSQIRSIQREIRSVQVKIDALSQANNAKIRKLEGDRDDVLGQQRARLAALKASNQDADGLLVRIQALASLSDDHFVIRAAHYLLALLILLIDVLPVVGKVLMSAGGRSPYEKLLAAREGQVIESARRDLERQQDETRGLRVRTQEFQRHRRALTRMELAEQRYRAQRRIDFVEEDDGLDRR